MADSSETLHERQASLEPATIDRHRAIASLREELEAVDWYDQRIDATRDRELREILIHNRDEEKEHAAMLIEWLRRRDPKVAEVLDAYLNTSELITAIELQEESGSNYDASELGDLGIGSLRMEQSSE